MRTWPALCLTGLAGADADTTDLLQAALVDHAVAAVEEVSPDEWRIYFESAAARTDAAGLLAAQFPAVHLDAIEVADEDWARRSQAGLRAIQAGALVVAPPWDVPGSPGRHVIVILPSMGFGTGYHATTRLCLEAMQQFALAGLRVADIGTGSGVLAIAASVLGATDVVGLDDDPDAVQSAQDNLALNPVARVRFLHTDLRDFDERGFDLVTANLTGALLSSTAAHLTGLVRLGGRLVLSGMLAGEVDDVLKSFGNCQLDARYAEDGWASLLLSRR
jgi:ribosomal protein L11 methyltransferase